MNGFDRSTTTALEALEVRPPEGHAWFGEPDRQHWGALPLRERLTARLYSDFYVHGTARRPGPGTRMDAGQAERFQLSLRDANAGTGHRQSGWRVLAAEAGALVVERDGLRIWAPTGDVVAAAEPGRHAVIRLPSERLRAAPGFYTALGDEEIVLLRDEPLVRVYWHLQAAGAAQLVSATTTRLNEQRVPFRLKVGDGPQRYDRADAGVLYLPRSRWGAAAPSLQAAYEEVAPQLRPEVPAWTKSLAPGVGLAEGSGDGASFGMDRCRLLAEAVLHAHRTGAATTGARLSVVRSIFRDSGIEPDAPHLQPGSVDRYEPWLAA